MIHVGILSMQNVNNYGSFWQAKSLSKMLMDIGCQVSFIDIIPGCKLVDDEYHRSIALSKIKRIPYYIYSYKRSKMYDAVKKEAFNKDDIAFDAVVIGSDEVFNCQQPSPWGFTKQLYGEVNCDNVFSYAASFGYTEYSFIKDKGIETEIASALNRMHCVSVRDENSQMIIKRLTGRNSEIHFDPVLLNKDLFNRGIVGPSLKQKYLLVYSYDFRLNEEKYIKEIRKYAIKNNLLIVAAGCYQDWADKNIMTTPDELLRLFYNAECVVTDTFHGTIFSVKSHKRFATIVRNSNRQKLGDLLNNRLGLSEHIVNEASQIGEVLNSQIDYSAIEDLLGIERHKSISYLQSALQI